MNLILFCMSAVFCTPLVVKPVNYITENRTEFTEDSDLAKMFLRKFLKHFWEGACKLESFQNQTLLISKRCKQMNNIEDLKQFYRKYLYYYFKLGDAVAECTDSLDKYIIDNLRDVTYFLDLSKRHIKFTEEYLPAMRPLATHLVGRLINNEKNVIALPRLNLYQAEQDIADLFKCIDKEMNANHKGIESSVMCRINTSEYPVNTTRYLGNHVDTYLPVNEVGYNVSTNNNGGLLDVLNKQVNSFDETIQQNTTTIQIVFGLLILSLLCYCANLVYKIFTTSRNRKHRILY